MTWGAQNEGSCNWKKTKQSQSNITTSPTQYVSSDTDWYSSASEKSNYRFPLYEYDTECDEKRWDDVNAPGTSHYKSSWSDSSDTQVPEKDTVKK
jgi:hypothetical protein